MVLYILELLYILCYPYYLQDLLILDHLLYLGNHHLQFLLDLLVVLYTLEDLYILCYLFYHLNLEHLVPRLYQ